MNTAKGYKQTEVGVIPEDWNICEFQDVMTGFSSGQTPYREIKRYYKGDIPWITSGELNYNVITDTVEKITPEAVRKTNLKIIPKGTFLFAITGLEAAGTRGSCGITGVEATTNQSCMALYPIRGKLVTKFLYHFYVKNGDLLAFKYCQGTKQQSYTAAIAKKLPIALPSHTKEQTAIANALSDMDALIAQTEKLIEKKKAIKQGVMQELLKPKEGWVRKKLGEVCEIIMGQSPLSEYYNFAGIGLPLIQGNADIKNRKTIIRTYSSNITKKGKLGDIIMTVRAPVGEIALSTFECCLGRGVCALRYENDFMYHYLISIENYWSRLSSGSTFDSVNSNQIRDLSVTLPQTKIEQIEIAKTLTDLDKDIELTETKLQKLKHQKQGMMQALLTGKIRLI